MKVSNPTRERFVHVCVNSTLILLHSIGVAPISQVTHVPNKNSNIQGRSLNVIKVIFHSKRNFS